MINMKISLWETDFENEQVFGLQRWKEKDLKHLVYFEMIYVCSPHGYFDVVKDQNRNCKNIVDSLI